MSDLKAIVRAAARLRAGGGRFVIATVVRVRGSSYRRPGARMLLSDEGWVAGSVSGGCLERDLVKKAFWRTDGGAPVVVTYDSTPEDDLGWAFGLGCGGVVEVLLERAPSASDPLVFAKQCIERQEAGAIATVIASARADVPIGTRAFAGGDGRLADDARAALAQEKPLLVAHDGFEVFAEPIVPPPRLFVAGAGHDTAPVCSIARTLGWDVVVCGAGATRARFPDADELVAPALLRAKVDASARPLAIVMGHHYERDRDALGALLASRARYVGVLGPRRRTARILEELGVTDDPRLHAPVGLDLGAETPQEIALAAIAEMQQALARASAASLRGKADIHLAETG